MILKLTIRRMKNHKKATLMMFVSLFLSLFFISSMTLYRDNQVRFQQQLNVQRYGKWQGTIEDDKEDFDIIGKMSVIEHLDNGEILGSFDQNMFLLANFELLEGRYPQNENEIIIETRVLDMLKKSYKCHQTITFDVNGEDKNFEVVGIMPAYEINWKEQFILKYPTVITTNMTSDESLLFVYDEDINKETLHRFSLLNVNNYAYPFLDSKAETDIIDSLVVIDILAFLGGVSVVGTVFIQQLFKRKNQIYSLCMLGIRESLIVKESICEGVILCLFAFFCALPLALISIFILFSNVSMLPVLEFYHIPLLQMILKCLFLVVSVLIEFVFSTYVIIISWNRQMKRTKVKKKRKHYSQMSLIVCSLIFILMSVFLTVEIINQKDSFYRQKLVYETNPHYIYEDGNVFFNDGFVFDENDEEMSVDDFVYEVDGKNKKELDEVSKIYGIESMDYSYIIPCAISLNLDFDETKSTVVRFHTLQYSREEFEKRGVDFSDKEYERFIRGDCAILAVEVNLWKQMENLENKNFIYEFYDEKPHDLNQSIYLRFNNQVKPVLLSSVKSIDTAFKNGQYSFMRNQFGLKDILCSEAFIEKYFGLKDGPYQDVNVRATKDATYFITDKKMSDFHFVNKRIELEKSYKKVQSEFLVALIQYLIFIVLMFCLLVNIWNGHLNAHIKEIGIMQTIGVQDCYILKKYWWKYALTIASATIVSFFLHVSFIIYNAYMSQQSLMERRFISVKDAKYNMKSFIDGWYAYYRGDQIIIIMLISLTLIFITYYLTKKMLKDNNIKKLHEG